MKKNNNIIGIYVICNTASLYITNIDEMNEKVTYYISIIDSEKKPRRSTCKIKYDINGDPFFNSRIGEIYFNDIMRC